MTLQISIIGGSGYTGGELLRLLLRHPEVDVVKVTSGKYTGVPVHTVHPNLRGLTDLKFSSREDVKSCDVLFTAVPHGTAMKHMRRYMDLADRIIDLSADFRLRNPEDYPKWYGKEHSDPELLEEFVYGLPELHREDLKGARYASGPGCLASASILGIYPLVKNGIIDPGNILVDAKVGSSAAGLEPSLASHHPERSHVIRLYAGTGHRHTAEIEQELDFGSRPQISFTGHAVEQVRGISATCHVRVREDQGNDVQKKDVWKVFRKEYGQEPFMRIVKARKGVFRYPEPKILAGTNHCDVGFEMDPHSNRIVVVSALDNLVKGAAGSAIQSMNIMSGLEETHGLDVIGLHPI